MNNGSHPSELVNYFSRANAKPFSVEFSKYVYRPRSTEDDREYFKFPAEMATPGYENLLASLKPEQDIALHSALTFACGEKMHIPMMDLSGKFTDAWVAPISRLMQFFGVAEFMVYGTGRSAHVYGLSLISPEQVVPFFARSLLLNLPDQPAIVDSRWIGHRLIAGYGSLRWSCNGGQYLQLPELIGKFKVG